MCTVTYLPTAKGALLTSNRDERVDRAPTEPPSRHAANALTYPRDAHAGGTWIALKNRDEAAVLLNGGFTNHIRKPSYRQSRGVIMLEIVNAATPVDYFKRMPLEEIEPFTLILLTAGKLVRCTWDGRRKHLDELDASQPYIWASATLYGHEAQQMRVRRLNEWLGQTAITAENVLNFHLQNEIRFHANQSFHPDRAAMATVSVTSIDLSGDEPAVYYRDLLTEKSFITHSQADVRDNSPAFNTLSWKVSRFLIRARSWEYWPLACVYLPMVPAWLWLSAKARSICFFGAANPSMRYSGFAGECKSRIYSLMPEGSYPETVLCETGCDREHVLALLSNVSFKFPLIAKPNVGERGAQVQLLETAEDLENYRRQSRVDFLLQPYIDYPNEAGIFYCRMPGNAGGHISGIVGKELLSVTGDGRSDILTLIMQDDRAILQLPALHAVLGEKMKEIPPKNEKIGLVPYGNHSRGAKFLDLSHRITPALTNVVDRLCRSIPGFYFGRLDIRFKSWEELEKGRHFSVIELNGAASEPTHIYDPGHSLFFAWKEIYRHWKILCEISIANARSGVAGMNFRDGLEMLKKHNLHLSLMRKI